MRRKDREITDQKQIRSIIESSDICFLGMCNNNDPYVVPMNFGYKGNYIYFHCALEGKKIDLLRNNPRVSLVFNSEAELHLEGQLQEWTTYYKSVIASGIADFIIDPVEKLEAINIILNRYTHKWQDFSSSVLNRVLIIRVNLTSLTGKSNPKPQD